MKQLKLKPVLFGSMTKHFIHTVYCKIMVLLGHIKGGAC